MRQCNLPPSRGSKLSPSTIWAGYVVSKTAGFGRQFLIIAVLLVLAVLLSGCTGKTAVNSDDTGGEAKAIVCNPPYLRIEDGCCLDRDGNGICDKDETTTTEPSTTTFEETTTTTSTAQAASTTSTSAATTSSQHTTTSQLATSTSSTTTTSTTLPAPCFDSDGGADEYAKGTTHQGPLSYIDSCQSPASVKEFYCLPSGKLTFKFIQCPKGCLKGECAGCKDSDGGIKPDVYGEVTLGETLTKKDVCSRVGDGKTLQEYYCKNRDEPGMQEIVCSGGCADGRCI